LTEPPEEPSHFLTKWYAFRHAEGIDNRFPPFNIVGRPTLARKSALIKYQPTLWSKKMKRLIIAVATVALMTGAAFAASDTGTIKQINPNSDAITLDDGMTFTLAEGTEAESLKIGQKVIVTYDMKAGKMVATKIVVTK
jgi:hypothetical protein